MKKEEAITRLKSTKAAHIKRMDLLKLLIDGMKIKEEGIDVDSTECNFGKWFYSDGQILNALPNNPLECMSKIEELHFKLHERYLQIFTIYFSQTKQGSFITQLFKFKKNISEADHACAESCYSELETISKEFLDEINRLERRLRVVSNEKIEHLA